MDAAARKIANTVSSKLMPPLANAKQIIENAEAHEGVTVNEDLSITYSPPEGTTKETADENAKTVAAAEAELKAEAAKWWAAENEVATQIRDAETTISKQPQLRGGAVRPAQSDAAFRSCGTNTRGHPNRVSAAAEPSLKRRSRPPGWASCLVPENRAKAARQDVAGHAAPRWRSSAGRAKVTVNIRTGSLADFRDQIRQGGVPPGWHVPIPAKDIEAFKALARETLRREGVPPAQIEQRLDAAVARAEQGYGLMGNRVPQPQGGGVPRPGFVEGFADRWHATEHMMRDLFGTGEPGDPGVAKSWAGSATGVAEAAVTPPIAGIAKDFLDSPSPAYFAGGAAADAALTAPSLLFGGEGAVVRAGLPAEIVTEGGAPLAVLRGWDPAGGLSWQDFEARFGTPQSRIWPGNDGFPAGYVPQPAHLPEGTIIDRFGSVYGQYLAPDGTAFADRALMPESVGGNYNRYMVTGEPLPPGWRIVEGPVEPWFGQTPSADARQYMILAPDGVKPTVKELVRLGILDDYGPPLGR